METELLRTHNITRRCDHHFVDSVVCVKCGYAPETTDVMANLYALWSRATYDEQCAFLLNVRTRSR